MLPTKLQSVLLCQLEYISKKNGRKVKYCTVYASCCLGLLLLFFDDVQWPEKLWVHGCMSALRVSIVLIRETLQHHHSITTKIPPRQKVEH